MNRLDEVGDDFRDAPMAALYEVSNKIKQRNTSPFVIQKAFLKIIIMHNRTARFAPF